MPGYQAQSRPCRTPIPTPPLFKHNHAPPTAFSCLKLFKVKCDRKNGNNSHIKKEISAGESGKRIVAGRGDGIAGGRGNGISGGRGDGIAGERGEGIAGGKGEGIEVGRGN